MGARQVGKTWLMEEFARNKYAGKTVAVNLMKNESLRSRFDTLDLDSDSVIDVIQLATGKRITRCFPLRIHPPALWVITLICLWILKTISWQSR